VTASTISHRHSAIGWLNQHGAALTRSLVVLLFLLISLCYAYAAVRLSASKPLWHDEVLAVSTAQLPGLAEVRAAIWQGAEFSPWTYHFLLHPLVTGQSPEAALLLARVPSIVAVYLAALCMFVLARRYAGGASALVAFGVILGTDLFGYAVQARQYAIISLGLALACLVWDDLAKGRGRVLKGLVLLLALGVAANIHFYGVVAVGSIASMEALWLITRRKVRLEVWLPVFTAAATTLVWLPLTRQFSGFVEADAASGLYHARPSVGVLLEGLLRTFTGGVTGARLLLLGALLASALALLARTRWPGRWLAALEDAEQPQDPEADAQALSRRHILLIGLGAYPLIAFLFGLVVVGSFYYRYIAPAALFPGLAIAVLLVGRLQFRNAFALLLSPILALNLLYQIKGLDSYSARSALVTDTLSDLASTEQKLPVVVGDPLRFVELMFAADPRSRSRLVYLLPPEGVHPVDTTGLHQVQRLKRIYPSWAVIPTRQFLRTPRCFYLLFEPTQLEATSPWLLENGYVGSAEDKNLRLFRAGGPQPQCLLPMNQ
jgi:hypothetical protein